MAFVFVPIFYGALEALGAVAVALETGAVVGETIGVGAAIGTNVARAGVGAAVGAAADATGNELSKVLSKSNNEAIKDVANASEEDWKEAGKALFMNKQELEVYKQKTRQKKEDARRYQEALNARQKEIDDANQFAENFYKSDFSNTQALQGLEVKAPSINEQLIAQGFGKFADVVSNQFTSRAEQINKVKKITQDLASFLTDDMIKALEQDITTKTYEDLITDFDTSHYLSEPILEYTLNNDITNYLANDEQYKQISQIYNGRKIVKESVFAEERKDGSGLRIFAGYEEDGNVAVYYEHGGIKIPTLVKDHIWTGPQSPNNGLPVDLLDTFSFYHDCTYQENGWFDRLGDYKYVSRLTQNFDRFPVEQHEFIRIAIKYFSSIGTMLSYYNQGQLGSDQEKFKVPTEEEINQKYLDFNKSQEVKSPTSIHFLNYVDSNIDVDAEIIKVFEDTLKESMVKNSGDIINQALSNRRIRKDRDLLDNLEIELV